MDEDAHAGIRARAAYRATTNRRGGARGARDVDVRLEDAATRLDAVSRVRARARRSTVARPEKCAISRGGGSRELLLLTTSNG
jgi:hypothetical protein